MSDTDLQAQADLAAAVMWPADRASRALGMQLLAVGPGTACVEMRVRPDMINGWGSVHGGIVASLGDSAFALACNSRGTVTVAAGLDVSFLEAAREGDLLTATATERTVRGRSGIYDVTVTREDGVVVAELRGRSRSSGRPIVDPARPGPGSAEA